MGAYKLHLKNSSIKSVSCRNVKRIPARTEHIVAKISSNTSAWEKWHDQSLWATLCQSTGDALELKVFDIGSTVTQFSFPCDWRVPHVLAGCLWSTRWQRNEPDRRCNVHYNTRTEDNLYEYAITIAWTIIINVTCTSHWTYFMNPSVVVEMQQVWVWRPSLSECNGRWMWLSAKNMISWMNMNNL